jgi:hypothetical protein
MDAAVAASVRFGEVCDYFLRRARITSSAPDTSASAVMPEAGLISGTECAPAIRRPERPTNSKTIPTDFIRDQTSLLFLATSAHHEHRTRNQRQCTAC